MTALQVPVFFQVLCIVFNIFSFLLYTYDKWKAKSNTWRISENLLLIVAALGPLGAYGAMIIFRHKTRKLKFYLVPIFLIVHIALFVLMLR